MICFSILISISFSMASMAVYSLEILFYSLVSHPAYSSTRKWFSFSIKGITLFWISFTLFIIYYFFRFFSSW